MATVVKTGMRLFALGLGAVMLMGCVMAEKYEQEKARGLNFQRLLAQEEKRTAELDAEVKKVRRQLTEMEAQNRDLSSEIQSAREQLSMSADKTMALQETAQLGEEADKAFSNMDSSFGSDGDTFSNLGLDDPAMPADTGTTGGGAAIYHEVMPGETLYRLSKTYGVKVENIKDWNSLSDNTIVVGQRLIIGYE